MKQIGEFIIQRTESRGLAVRISAVHMCKTRRGVRASLRGRIVTTHYFGALVNNAGLQQQFLRECGFLQ